MKIKLENIKKIIIFRNDGIGDILNSTPAIHALRKAYADAYITVVTRPPSNEILFNNPDVNDILVYDPQNVQKSLKAKITFIRKLKAEQYDLAIVLHNSSVCNLLAYFSNARYRVGRKNGGKAFSFILTHGVNISDPKGTKHEVDRNLDIVDLVGAETVERKLILKLSAEERACAEEIVISKLKVPISSGKRFCLVGIHPGGSSYDKLWPAEKFAEIANRLIKNFNSCIMLFNGPGEEKIAEKIKNLMKVPPICMQNISIRKMSALIEKCSLFICNDSGPMHIASALNVPTVAIFGSTDHVRWQPYNDKAVIVRRNMECWPCSAHKCKRDFECTKLLSVEDVWEAIKGIDDL